VSFMTWREAPGTHWIGGLVGPRFSQDAVEKKMNSASTRNRTPILRRTNNPVTELPQSTSCRLMSMLSFLQVSPTTILYNFLCPCACCIFLGRPARYLTNFLYSKYTGRSDGLRNRLPAFDSRQGQEIVVVTAASRLTLRSN
jgi:hypothetical protein